MNRHAAMLWFHWLTALLVTFSFALAWLREDIEDLEARAMWLDAHRTIGIVILALTVVRLASRLKFGPMSQREDLPPAFWLASRVTHALIYAALLAMPLLGWAQSSARARNFQIFGIPMPRLVGHDRDMAEIWGWWHEQVAWALLALVLIHALAAIYHHYVRRDDTVRAMLPGWDVRRPSLYRDGPGAPPSGPHPRAACLDPPRSA